MLSYNEIKRGRFIVFQEEPYKVLESTISKKNRNKPNNQTKIKSLISGKTLEKTFHSSDSVKEADLSRENIKYLYIKNDEVCFCIDQKPKERFFLNFSEIKDKLKFLKQNDVILGLYFEEKLIDLIIPDKVTLKVKNSPPAVAGNSATSASKKITLENDLEIFVPLFIKEEDFIIINTEKGEYVERKK